MSVYKVCHQPNLCLKFHGRLSLISMSSITKEYIYKCKCEQRTTITMNCANQATIHQPRIQEYSPGTEQSFFFLLSTYKHVNYTNYQIYHYHIFQPFIVTWFKISESIMRNSNLEIEASVIWTLVVQTWSPYIISVMLNATLYLISWI